MLDPRGEPYARLTNWLMLSGVPLRHIAIMRGIGNELRRRKHVVLRDLLMADHDTS